MAALLILLTLALAAANGANDVSKGIATLVGSGTSCFRAAVLWGAAWTVAGGVAAAFAAQGLVATFGGRGLLAAAPPSGSAFLAAVAIGAVGWVLLATATGLPVSTTHALAGALCGAGVAAVTFDGVRWGAVAQKTLLPLALSPLLSFLLVLALAPPARRAFRRFGHFCVCVERHEEGTLSAGAAAMAALPSVAVIAGSDCPPATLVRVRILDSVHWLSAGATCFFRGLNDTPKIVALGVAAAAVWDLPPSALYAGVAAAMGLGSVTAGLRVTRTLAEKVTRIETDQGLASNLATSLLVGLASRFTLPVSTTHVATGAILGAGRREEVRWATVRDVLLAWVVTLPASALLAGGIHLLVRRP